MNDVVVIGAGVVGLSCAVRLQQAGARVSVVTAEPPERTVSRVAAAVWYPTHTRGDARVLRWAQRTYEELAAQAAHGVPGVVMRPTRMLLRAPAPRPWWAAAAPDFRVSRPAEVRAPFAAEWRFTAPTAEMGPYLDWLVQRFTSGGGVLLRRRVTRLLDVQGLAPLVVNAAGLGAGALASDIDVHPVRGQIVLVENPGLTTSVRDEEDPAGPTYVHPRSTDVVLGGTFEEGATDLTPSAAIGEAIFARCAALVPELSQARVLDQLVGLRPSRRGGARVEVDAQGLPGGGRVIHAYGHGGAGVTLGWGSAEEVVSLAQSALR